MSVRPSPRELPAPPAFPIAVDQVVIEIAADPANPGGRLVLQDGVESSYIDIAHPQRLGFEYQRHLAGIVDVVHPKRHALNAFQIGGGPCALMRYLDATRQTLRATVAEIDAGVVDVAERYLGLRQSERLRLRVGDGRELLATQPDDALDLLVVDAFLGLVVPHRLVTDEFVRIARTAVRQEGLHLVNLIDIPPHDFAKAVAATLVAHYATVFVLADERVVCGGSSGNVVVAASDRAIPLAHIVRRSAHDRDPWQVLSGRALTHWIGDSAVLFDDVAPMHDLALLGDLFGRSRRRPSEDA